MAKRVAIIVPVVLLMVAAALFSNLFPFRQMLAADRAIAAAESDLTELESENARLADDLDALRTSEEIERLARDELGYVFPGEQGFVVVAPDEEPETRTDGVVEPLPEPRPWYAPIVDFLIGADLEE
jgi:cell division protein FtsB